MVAVLRHHRQRWQTCPTRRQKADQRCPCRRRRLQRWRWRTLMWRALCCCCNYLLVRGNQQRVLTDEWYSSSLSALFDLPCFLLASTRFDEARLAWRCRLAGRKFRAPKRPRVAVMRSNQRSACDESIQAAPLSLLSFPETPVEGLYLIWINSFAFFSAIGSVRVASHPRSLSILFAIGIFCPHSTVRQGAHCYITAPAPCFTNQDAAN